MFSRKQKKNTTLPRLGKAYEELNTLPPNVPTGNLLGLNNGPGVAAVPNSQARSSANLEGLFNAAQPFEVGIFLDNDETHRRSVKTSCGVTMTTPTVPETYGRIPGILIQSATYVALLERMSEEGKKAARLLSRLCLLLGGGKENYDSFSGIQPRIVNQIKEWVDTHEGKRRVAIFDFDRTLSVMEGGYFLENSIQRMRKRLFELETTQQGRNGKQIVLFNGSPIDPALAVRPHLFDFTAEGFANYLAGGTERMTMLQEMFDYLYDHDVKIILLTNNTGCPFARELFREITEIYTRGRPIEVICGVEFGGVKGTAVRGRPTDTGNLKSLRDMCLRTYGGKRKTKRHPKKRRHKL
jgi:hypothetical protein